MDLLGSAGCGLRWKVSILLMFFLSAASGQIRYSIPEEMRKGQFVGDVAKDLGMDVKRLRSEEHTSELQSR